MRSLRLSGLLEQEGRLRVDEAAALAWRLLSEAPARKAPAPEGESDERAIEMGMPVLPEWDDPDD
jgi:hypothetical protein